MNLKHPSIQSLIQKLNLSPLWSTDYLGQFYSSTEIIPRHVLGKEFDGDRLLFTWAYYLIPEDCICPMHLMYADESWQYCAGGPLDLFLISPEGETEKITIGNNIENGERFIYIVPKGYWFAATPQKGSEYTLITHLVSPGFAPQDWIRGYHDDLIKMFPQASEWIKKYGWPIEN